MSDQLIGIVNPRRKRRRGGRRKKAATTRRRTRRVKRATTRRAPRRARRRRHAFAAAAPAPRHRRRRGRTKARRRGALRGRRNPGALVMNPGGSLMATIKAAAPLIAGVTGGLIGTRMASGIVARYVPGGDNPWVRVGIRAGLTVGGYYLLKRISRKAANGVLIGGGVATVEAAVQAAAPDFAASIGLGQPGLLGVGEIRTINGVGSIETMNGLACGELVSNY